MKLRKITPLLLGLSLLLSLCACGGSAGTPAAPAPAAETPAAEPTAEPAAQEPAAVVFTDSLGRAVEVPAHIQRVAVTGSLAQIALFALAPERMVGVATAWDASAEQYFAAESYHLPVLGQLYGGKGELNLETLLAAAPDVVIDVGEPKDGITEDLDALQAQVGLPFVHISARTETMGDAYRRLGELLGLTERAEELARYCEATYAQACALIERVGEENKTTLLYLLGDAGLNVIARGSYHAEIIDLMADNAAVVDHPSAKGLGNETDMEQLLLWNPEVILFAPDSVYESVGEDAAWQQLDAIRSGRYYRVPFEPYNWLGFPPSVQRYLGLLWLGTLLYPESVDYELQDAVTEYYRLFYHCELTQTQYDALMAQSLRK